MNDSVKTHLPIILRKDSGTEQPPIKMAASSERLMVLPSQHTNTLDLGVLSMCSGAALDVITCAFLRYSQRSPEEALHVSITGPRAITAFPNRSTSILNLLRDHPNNPNAMINVHKLLGEMYSDSATEFLSIINMPTKSIHLITARADSIPPSVTPLVLFPQNNIQTDPALQSWAAVLAAEIGVTTTTNLPLMRRPVDGSDTSPGSPLESLFLRHSEKYRVCLNIGELMSLTIIPPRTAISRRPPPTSICGPGTLFIDYVMRYVSSNKKKTDEDGAYSREGKVSDLQVNEFLRNNDYSVRLPSLSIATEMYGSHEVQTFINEYYKPGENENDIAATITRITAENILRQYNRLVALYCPRDRKIEEIFICGPGARNMSIVDYLEDKLPKDVITRPIHDVGIPDNAMEVLSCAQLGLETILKHARNEDGPFQQSQQGRDNGGAAKGQNWENLRHHIMNFSGGKSVYAVQDVVVANDGQRL